MEYDDIRFLAYDGGRCRGVLLFGWLVFKGGIDDALVLGGEDWA